MSGLVGFDTHLTQEDVDSSTTSCGNPKTLNSQESSGLHRRRTLYLVRHGEALHNVQEAAAQEAARQQCEALGLSREETYAKMEEARQNVLKDASLKDAPLTEKGRQQAVECAQRLQQIIQQGHLPPPSEAMVSPLTRTLETCDILLDGVQFERNDPRTCIKAHVRPELQERQTQYPPDTARSRQSIFRYSKEKDNFSISKFNFNVPYYEVTDKDIEQESQVRESKEMLRERASKLFDLLLEMEHCHVLIVSHKGYLRELERGLLGLTDSPLFGNAELRVYRVVFTRGQRELESIERLA